MNWPLTAAPYSAAQGGCVGPGCPEGLSGFMPLPVLTALLPLRPPGGSALRCACHTGTALRAGSTGPFHRQRNPNQSPSLICLKQHSEWQSQHSDWGVNLVPVPTKPGGEVPMALCREPISVSDQRRGKSRAREHQSFSGLEVSGPVAPTLALVSRLKENITQTEGN